MRTLLGCGKGSLRSRISVLIVEPPDLRLPRPAARTCARTPARRLAAVLARQQVQRETAGLGAAGAVARKIGASGRNTLANHREKSHRLP